MAAIKENETPRRKNVGVMTTVITVGEKVVYSFFVALFCNTARVPANVGWLNNPTVRSQKARLRNMFSNVAVIDEAFHKARITRKFPMIATNENRTFITQIHRLMTG